MENEIRLEIIGLVYNQAVVNTYGLVLCEKEGNRRFSVMIGEPEAQSIALKMNNKILARPLTHDLIKNILMTMQADLKKVLIYDLVSDIFYSELYIETKDNKIFVVDARTSDAVALAVRADCPIYIKKEILDVVGTEIDPPTEEHKEYTLKDLEELTDEEMAFFTKEQLDDFLLQAVNEEKYELAVKIRNAQNMRRG